MQLKEQGVLDLEEDIRKYLPDGFLTHLHYDKPVTMLHLMNHTAGFDELLYDLETADEKEIIPLRNFLKKYQPNQSFEPGVISSYSNWGAALAAYIVESKTELTGEKCKLLNDYIKKLEKLKSDIKDYVVNASTIANTNNERTMIIEILRMIKECE